MIPLYFFFDFSPVAVNAPPPAILLRLDFGWRLDLPVDFGHEVALATDFPAEIVFRLNYPG